MPFLLNAGLQYIIRKICVKQGGTGFKLNMYVSIWSELMMSATKKTRKGQLDSSNEETDLDVKVKSIM
jgi:hypothetical protein